MTQAHESSRQAVWNIKWQYIPLMVMVAVLLSWLLVEGLGLLTFEEIVFSLQSLNQGAAAAVIVGLLVIDVLVPIPSTPIITISGTIFSFWGGVLLTVVGSMASSAFAYWLGKYGRDKFLERLVKPEELAEMEAWSDYFGKWALIIARALPMMAETVGISAGVARMSFASFMLYTFIGTLPICAAYVLAGTNAEQVEEILMIVAAGFILSAVLAHYLRKRARPTVTNRIDVAE